MYERFNSKKRKKKKKRTPPSNNPRVPRVLGTGTVKGGYTLYCSMYLYQTNNKK